MKDLTVPTKSYKAVYFKGFPVMQMKNEKPVIMTHIFILSLFCLSVKILYHDMAK